MEKVLVNNWAKAKRVFIFTARLFRNVVDKCDACCHENFSTQLAAIWEFLIWWFNKRGNSISINISVCFSSSSMIWYSSEADECFKAGHHHSVVVTHTNSLDRKSRLNERRKGEDNFFYTSWHDTRTQRSRSILLPFDVSSNGKPCLFTENLANDNND